MARVGLSVEEMPKLRTGQQARVSHAEQWGGKRPGQYLTVDMGLIHSEKKKAAKEAGWRPDGGKVQRQR